MKIEEYRGVDIHYSEELDKFYCAIVPERRQSKRQSLLALRKDVDAHFRSNEKFVPFKCMLSKYSNDPMLVWVKSIRVDGDLMISNNEDLSEAYRLSQYEFKYLYENTENNQLAFAEIKRLNEEEGSIQKKYQEARGEQWEKITALKTNHLKDGNTIE